MGKIIDLGIVGKKMEHLTGYVPAFTAIAERWEARGAVKYTYRAGKDEEREKEEVAEHEITSAGHTIVVWLHDERKAEEDEGKLGINQIFMYFHCLKVTTHFLSALAKFVEHARQMPAKTERNRQFKKRVLALTRKTSSKFVAETEQFKKWMGEDMQFLYAEINAAGEEGTGKFIENWRTRAKRKEISSRLEMILERRGIRFDIKTENIDRQELERLSTELEEINMLLDRASKEETSIKEQILVTLLNRFENILVKSENTILKMFRAAHQVLMRDLILMAIALTHEGTMEALGKEWVKNYLMPKGAITSEEISIHELEKKLGENAHTIANGLNVVMKEVSGLETKAKGVYARAAA